MTQTTPLHDSLGLCRPLASPPPPLPFCCSLMRVSSMQLAGMEVSLAPTCLHLTCSVSQWGVGLLAWHGGVSQTCCDSIDCSLFTERSSEQDQLNIYYGRSIPAEELSNELDISLASLPAGARPPQTCLPAAFLLHLRRTEQQLLEGSYSAVVPQIDLVWIWSECK